MGSCVAVVCGHNVGHGRQHVKSVCFSCTLGSKTMGNSVVMLCLQPMALFDLSSEVQPSTPWTVCHSPNAATHRMPTIVIMTALSEAFHSADRTVCTAVRSSQDFYISFCSRFCWCLHTTYLSHVAVRTTIEAAGNLPGLVGHTCYSCNCFIRQHYFSLHSLSLSFQCDN
jgi:hypothetical protein